MYGELGCHGEHASFVLERDCALLLECVEENCFNIPTTRIGTEVERRETTRIHLVRYASDSIHIPTMNGREGVLHGREEIADLRLALSTHHGLKREAQEVLRGLLLRKNNHVPFVYAVEVVQVRLLLVDLHNQQTRPGERFRGSGRKTLGTSRE